MTDQKRFKITIPVTVCMEFEATGGDAYEAEANVRRRIEKAPDPLRMRVPKWVHDVIGSFKFEEISNG